MDTRPQRLHSIRILLTRVLEGQIEPNTALSSWPDIDREPDKLVQAAWHELYHYATDEDIREKDPQYAEGQRERLQWYSHEIERREADPEAS